MNALRLVLILTLAMALGCDRKPTATGGVGQPTGRPVVLATTGMVADLARLVGGEAVDIRQLMGPGVDPHLYKPTRDDVAQLLAADVVLANGLHLEGKLDEAFDRASNAGKRVVRLADRLGATNPPKAELHDPHVWMDPVLWGELLPDVAEALIAVAPSRADVFKANAQAAAARFADLDARAKIAFMTIPAGRRVLVTAHDAFRYFGRRYEIQVEGIQGISTESEAGLRDIERLVSLLVSRKVPAVFVESTVSERNIRALIDGAAAQGHTVVVGGSLYSDAMGPMGTPEGTYLGMIEHNVRTIVTAMGGVMPVSTDPDGRGAP